MVVPQFLQDNSPVVCESEAEGSCGRVEDGVGSSCCKLRAVNSSSWSMSAYLLYDRGNSA
jgi:hypothetical protein